MTWCDYRSPIQRMKDLISLFKDEGLSITIDTNLIETDFLDVSFNLNTGKYFPFNKPNKLPLYIHSKSNHPPSIINQLPSMTNKCIPNLSCDETDTRRNRNKKMIWFNPHFSLNVKTNIVKEFFKLIRKHFPRDHSFIKILNLNTIKQHKARVLKNQERTEKRSCNCRVKDSCPLDGKWLQECIAYQANVMTNNECKKYFGTAEREFKLRYNNHTMSFRHKKRVSDTELSKYLRNLKEENVNDNLQWSIKAYASPYKFRTRKCDFCLTEKMIIARSDPKKLLNKRRELISKCRHRNKFLVSNIK